MQTPQTIEEKDTMNFSSEPHNIALIEPLVTSVLEKYSISNEIFGNVLVAITEATNNAIQHGNKQDPKKKVHISYTVDNEMIRFTIQDEGQGFNPDVLPDPTDPENIEKPHGRGVFLMRRLADSISFEENGTRVCLGFKINPS
ncbi:MAG: ATP-binding protein [Flavobacteriales bacterium]|nr:ATP-binding protein [Flavobacteriales bacterium]